MTCQAPKPAAVVPYAFTTHPKLNPLVKRRPVSNFVCRVEAPQAPLSRGHTGPAVCRCCQSTSLGSRSRSAASVLVLSSVLVGGALAADPAEVFQRSGCVGCHAGGGNVVQAGASLQTRDLEKNGAATVDAIYKLIYSGKGKMPGYGKDCQPRGKCTFGPRLADDDIQRLSQYVVDKAAVQWK